MPSFSHKCSALHCGASLAFSFHFFLAFTCGVPYMSNLIEFETLKNRDTVRGPFHIVWHTLRQEGTISTLEVN